MFWVLKSLLLQPRIYHTVYVAVGEPRGDMKLCIKIQL